MIKILKKGLSNFTGDAWLIETSKSLKVKDWYGKKKNYGKYFVVSGTLAMFTGWEVLIFPATKTGKVKKFHEVAGGRGISHAEAIKELEGMLND